MKKSLLIILINLIVFQLSAQKPIMYDSLFYFDSTGMSHQTPIVFDMSNPADQEYFVIDTSQVNNIWQYAKVNKPGFAQLNSIALTTDSVANYPINDTSSFIFKIIFSTMNTTLHDFISLGITLHHKYQTDSLHDGLRIEYYSFFNHEWVNGTWGLQNLVVNRDSSYNWGNYYIADPLSGNQVAFHYSRLAYAIPGVKGSVDSVLLRFTFVSDSIQNNMAGWLIDSIMIEANCFCTGGFNECKLAQNDYLAYYDGNSIIINSLLAENRKSDFTLFDMMGRELLIDEIHFGINTINVDNLPTGYYIVKVKNQAGVFTKKILIE
jgi:hypothetical protein